ncbi:putative NBD/HSP70 family sugar kinase [Lipingzhangella halophila]|uniref:Putative NBD/HSP70 family sugar kinase n=1 Tax=Lipingzhangella halophila TaxID=1783352 RepID=A0A7W7W5Y2_9ACTN|nr:ROK family protein [Lipingzhangella halophila]MBB4935203.1 putative NBD/HSP70 family sugar kinase [Lipingzhangella halophila]
MAEAPASAGHMLELIRSGKARTRRDLQSLTGLSRSTVLQRLDLLTGAGWVREHGVASSTGGRPPTRLEFNEEHAVVLAADLDTTHARAAVLDLAGRTLAEHTAPLRVSDGPVPVLDTLADWFRSLIGQAERGTTEVCGIGLSVPGPVEFATGLVVRPPMMAGWDGYDIGAHLRSGFDVPVLVDNDANMMALGEQVASYPECPAFVLVKVSTGIGAGVIINGEVYRGIDGGAGDIGHVRITGAADALCQCGSYGCLAAVASGRALAAALTDEGVPTPSGAGVRERLRADHPSAVRMAREAGQQVGEVLATVVSLLNPEVLMIAGDLADTHFVTGVRELLYQRALPRITRNLKVVTGELGDRAGLRGTGHLVTEYLYAPAQADTRLAEGHATG